MSYGRRTHVRLYKVPSRASIIPAPPLHFAVMFFVLLVGVALLSVLVEGRTALFDRNLAYSSPFADAPHVSGRDRSKW